MEIKDASGAEGLNEGRRSGEVCGEEVSSESEERVGDEPVLCVGSARISLRRRLSAFRWRTPMGNWSRQRKEIQRMRRERAKGKGR